MDTLIDLLKAIGHGLESGKNILESFFINFLVFKDFPGLPKWLSHILNGLIVALLAWTAYPSVKLLFKKSPTLLENILNAIFEVAQQLIDYCKSILLNRIPLFAEKILSLRYYGNILLWASVTDGEAITRATQNKPRISARRLIPYQKQTLLGLSVLLIAAWSAMGFSVALLMSFTGSTSLDLKTLTPTQLTATIIATVFFGLFILSLDRVLVSDSTEGKSHAICSWISRIIISLVLASWVSSAYNALLNEQIIHKKLSEKATSQLTSSQKEVTEYDEHLRQQLEKDRVLSPQCLDIKKSLDGIQDRLKAEELADCPKGRTTGCRGEKYREIQREEGQNGDRFTKNCPIRELTPIETQIKATNKEKLDTLTAEEKNPKFDLAIATDTLREIGVGRRALMIKSNPPDGLLDELKIWASYQPNLTYMILITIDLIPLIVKFFAKSSYLNKLREVETERINATPAPISTDQRLIVWDPFNLSHKLEKRWHI